MKYNNKVDAIQDKLASLESQYIGLIVMDVINESIHAFNSVTRKIDLSDPKDLIQLDWYSWKENELIRMKKDKIEKVINVLCTDKNITYIPIK